MLWKRLRDSNKQTISSKNGDMNKKVNGKKLIDMAPDEKVEAMIKLGMLWFRLLPSNRWEFQWNSLRQVGPCNYSSAEMFC